MSVTVSDIRPGAYFDSVVLMQLQRDLVRLDGVIDAGIVMATPANRDLLASSDLLPPEATAATAEDLLIVVRADDDRAARAALVGLDDLIRNRQTASGTGYRPRSLAGALRQAPEAGWILISVAGRYAAAVAREALDAGRHVFLYSDNVDLADEEALKRRAAAAGLLVMGPDCGTAIVNGIGLGFANRVPRGNIGLVGASGTGLQALSTQVGALGAGISHAIGTGGRDLKSEIDGRTTRQALDLLARDPDTHVLVLVSKPPAPRVAARLLAAAGHIGQTAGKPIVVYFQGLATALEHVGPWVHLTTSLNATARLAVALSHAGMAAPESAARPSFAPPQRYLRGLFSGGTLAYEAVLGLGTVLDPLFSNVPVRPEQALSDPFQSQHHTILDLGADHFTQGRLHPMMDNETRLRRLRQEAADPGVAVILMDLVLGAGAHPDPAAELAPAIAAARNLATSEDRRLEVLVAIVGAGDDPQDVAAQREALAAAGARVYDGLEEPLQRVIAWLAPDVDEQPPVSLERLQGPLVAINIGLESFRDSLEAQGARCVHVDWRPPAGGNEAMMALLDQLSGRDA